MVIYMYLLVISQYTYKNSSLFHAICKLFLLGDIRTLTLIYEPKVYTLRMP